MVFSSPNKEVLDQLAETGKLECKLEETPTEHNHLYHIRMLVGNWSSCITLGLTMPM